MYRLHPLFDRVLVERCASTEYIEDEDGNWTTKEGISVTPDQVEKHPEFKIVRIGSMCEKLKKQKVKVGDIVLLGQMSGVEYHDSMLVYEDEILGKLEEMEPTETE